VKEKEKFTARVERLNSYNWSEFEESVYTIEEASYEVERRHSEAMIKRTVLNAAGVSLVALTDGMVAGFCIGAPISEFRHLSGPSAEMTQSNDEMILYAADLCVADRYRGCGIARQLKIAQIERAKQDGYRLLVGRNRVGFADAMWRLNQSLGAESVSVIDHAYKDYLEPNATIYYHIKLR